MKAKNDKYMLLGKQVVLLRSYVASLPSCNNSGQNLHIPKR